LSFFYEVEIPGIIHWNDISNFKILKFQEKGFVVLTPKNKGNLLTRVGFLNRIAIESASEIYDGSIYFGSMNADIEMYSYLSLLKQKLGHNRTIL